MDATKNQTPLIETLYHVFRNSGYDATSINQLVEVTGLKKASLYHRFPGGKAEMADQVWLFVQDWMDKQIFSITKESLTPKEQLELILDRLSTFYQHGRATVLTQSFLVGEGKQRYQEKIGQLFQKLIGVFEQIALNLNYSALAARKLGEQSLIRLQGSIVLAQCLKDQSIFRTTIVEIERSFQKQENETIRFY